MSSQQDVQLLRILVVGGGGREHAIAWALSKSPSVEKIFCAPGNGGTATMCTKVENCQPRIESLEFSQLLQFAKLSSVNLVVPCPDEPLVRGITDYFRREGFRVFGPSKQAAQIEGSKCWAKCFMTRHSIPTASYQTFSTPEAAIAYLEGQTDQRWVVKASGLAAGKGVTLAENLTEAIDAVKSLMIDCVFGDAGREIVIEEFLEGREISMTLMTDGKTWKLFPPGQDTQRIYDGNIGPNTGGMGVIASPDFLTEREIHEIGFTILEPTIQGLCQEGFPFVGFICIGLMQTSDGPKLLEYNARFGDPEAQTLLPLMDSESDLAALMVSCTETQLHTIHLGFQAKAAVSVVMASHGYPTSYSTGQSITIKQPPQDVLFFHAGTRAVNGKLEGSGGRVLASVCLADSMLAAVEGAYKGVDQVSFEGKYYRTDIGRTQGQCTES
ncbi:hypothetical protein CEP52_001693 [Fusarium oligoseptatum]|uniref:phosphoribosylamine--glycine ligase n=1 Tax=Fusarium oligoseptatum TaxID=2604345 RepID=A0A428UHP7_9HYPO|nr:hypothetical protein CEP52_001693 [Fusarium oligoseptatum]